MRSSQRCPRTKDLVQPDGAAEPSTQEHLSSCTICKEELRTHKKLSQMARNLEPPRPSREQTEQIRAELIARAGLLKTPAAPATTGQLHRALFGVTLVFAAAAALWLFLRRSEHSATTTNRAVVVGQTGAVFSRASEQPDEVVRLAQGRISVTVSPLAQNERFRVITDDSEIEVRGTAFDVVADRGKLMSVVVSDGRVEVRPSGGHAVFLSKYEKWTAPTQPVAKAETNVAPPPHVDHLPNESQINAPTDKNERRAKKTVEPATDINSANTQLPSPTELAFEDGWSLLRSGDPERAGPVLSRAAQIDPAAPLSEDALFWAGVAFSRADHPTRAIAQFELFVKRYPKSSRAGEAAVNLGWLLFNQGALERADELFTAAERDLDSRIRESARRGRDAITAKSRADATRMTAP